MICSSGSKQASKQALARSEGGLGPTRASAQCRAWGMDGDTYGRQCRKGMGESLFCVSFCARGRDTIHT